MNTSKWKYTTLFNTMFFGGIHGETPGGGWRRLIKKKLRCTKLSVTLPEVSRLKIADSKGVRSRTTSLPENSYVKALARLGIC